MSCPDCAANTEAFCTNCGKRLRHRAVRGLRWLLGFCQLVISFVVLLAGLVFGSLGGGPQTGPLLFGGVLLALGLFTVSDLRPRCTRCQGARFCGDCGRNLDPRPRPFRLAILIFGTLGGLLLGFVAVASGVMMTAANHPGDQFAAGLMSATSTLLSVLCARAVSQAAR